MDSMPAGKQSASLRTVSEALNDSMRRVEDDLTGICTDLPQGVSEPVGQLISAGGKRARPLVCILSFLSMDGDTSSLPLSVATASELIHTATLLHDDVVDEGEWRRGAPTARLKWGNASAVISGDYLLALALRRVTEYGNREIVSALVRVLHDMAAAEALQLTLRGSVKIREQDYWNIVRGKTARLFTWCAESGATAAGASMETVKTFVEFGEAIGTCFQVIDDVLDLRGDTQTVGKSVLADVSEGKLTLPVILAIKEKPGLADLIKKASDGSGPPESEVLDEIRTQVVSSGGIEKALSSADSYSTKAMNALMQLPATPARDGLKYLTDLLLKRTS